MEQITLTTEELDRLLAIKDGDAALMYLALKRGGADTGLSEARVREARKKLSGAGLAPSILLECPVYDSGEIAQSMLTDPGYHIVVCEAERLLGRALSPSDLQILFSIYQWRGLPPGVILMLLHHSAGEQRRQRKTFSLRQADKEAAVWEREGILDEASAEQYITRLESSREASAKVFKSMGIFGRTITAAEKNYVASWLNLGFSVEAIALAYEKTVLNTGKLAWSYCDKILNRWHASGWHTPAQIESNEKAKPSGRAEAPENRRKPSPEGVERTRQALRLLQEE